MAGAGADILLAAITIIGALGGVAAAVIGYFEYRETEYDRQQKLQGDLNGNRYGEEIGPHRHFSFDVEDVKVTKYSRSIRSGSQGGSEVFVTLNSDSDHAVSIKPGTWERAIEEMGDASDASVNVSPGEDTSAVWRENGAYPLAVESVDPSAVDEALKRAAASAVEQYKIDEEHPDERALRKTLEDSEAAVEAHDVEFEE
jgi:hypothetical protein